jgi:pimeloyl-ACP methyl ester carboxylesterase
MTPHRRSTGASLSFRRKAAPAGRTGWASLLAAAVLVGCADRSLPPSAPLDEAACSALASLSLSGTEITAVDWIESGALHVAGMSIPAHCRIQGVIDRRVGRGGVPYGIGFELRLPAEWKRGFYFQGGSGTDGVVVAALGWLHGGNPLGEGFAVVSTDSGHSGAGPEFGLDEQARIDYGYRAIERVTERAKAITAAVYGRAPERSYFVGCSNGGRQGLVAAERFPDLFDGIIAGSPGFDLPKAAVAEAWNLQAVAALATHTDAAGEPFLGDTFSDADLALLSNGVLRACDAADGLADGVVDDLPDCRFDPESLRCPAEKDATCLTADQIAALEKIFGGAHDSRGEPLYASFPYDAGIGDPNPVGALRAWSLGSPRGRTNTALNVTLGAGALAFVFVTPPVDTADPLGFVLGFDFDRDAPKIFATAGEYAESSMSFMTATSPDLTAFRRHGGKLIVYHGASDGVFSVNDTIRWYESVSTASGGRAADFARLFVVPGLGHCLGGPATDQFDALAPLLSWVEDDQAPDRLIATASAGTPFPGRTRPLCPYPKQARYLGGGSIETADSFDCR